MTYDTLRVLGHSAGRLSARAARYARSLLARDGPPLQSPRPGEPPHRGIAPRRRAEDRSERQLGHKAGTRRRDAGRLEV